MSRFNQIAKNLKKQHATDLTEILESNRSTTKKAFTPLSSSADVTNREKFGKKSRNICDIVAMIFLVLWLILKLFSASRHDSTNRVKFCSILLVIICARSTPALVFSRLSREAGTALTNQLRLKSILPLNAEKMKAILRRNRLTSTEYLQYEQLDGFFAPKRRVTLCL